MADFHTVIGNPNSRQPRMEFTRRRSRSRSQSASRDRGRAPNEPALQYRYVSSSPQRWFSEGQVRHVQPPDLGSAPSGAWASRSSSTTQRYDQNRDRSPHHEVRHERFYQSETRMTPPVPTADATAEYLFHYFKNTPAPDHLANEPKKAMLYKWAKWLVEVRNVENENAWTMARMYVDERWQNEETTKNNGRPSDNPRLQQRRNEEIRDSRVHRHDSAMGRQTAEGGSTSAPSLQRAHTDGETFTRGRSMERRVHWADTESQQVQINAGQPRSMQNLPVRNAASYLDNFS